MRAAALVAFVLGVCLLQTQAVLPSVEIVLLVAAGAIVVLAAALSFSGHAVAHAAVLTSIFALGFTYAASFATWRMSDELKLEDEGRDVALSGTISSLPVRLERGVRFEFDIDSVETPNIHIPSRVLLGWYNGNIDVKPGERWRFSVRLKRPHGTINPGGFDFEA